jgi:hypothetical protein
MSSPFFASDEKKKFPDEMTLEEEVEELTREER